MLPSRGGRKGLSELINIHWIWLAGKPSVTPERLLRGPRRNDSSPLLPNIIRVTGCNKSLSPSSKSVVLPPLTPTRKLCSIPIPVTRSSTGPSVIKATMTGERTRYDFCHGEVLMVVSSPQMKWMTPGSKGIPVNTHDLWASTNSEAQAIATSGLSTQSNV